MMAANRLIFIICVLSCLFLFILFTSLAAPVTDPAAFVLYNSEKDVGITILNSSNINSTLFTTRENGESYTGEVLWLVQFYNTWCGHCQHFAPKFKLLANRTLAWSKHVMLGVVDCSLQTNAGICNSYEIGLYPTMRFFPPHTRAYNHGTQYSGPHTEVGVYSGLIDYVQKIGFPAETVPLPAKNADEMWASLKWQGKDDVKDLALIVEESGSEVATDVILSVLGQTEVLAVARTETVNKILLDSLGTNIGKGLWLLRKGGEITKLEMDSVDATPWDLKSVIYAKDDELAVSRGLPKFLRIPLPYLQSDTTTKPSDTSNSAKDSPKTHAIIPSTVLPLNLTDMTSAISNMFSMEVASHAEIKNEDFSALKLFVKLIAELIPFPSPTYNAVIKLNDVLQSSTEIEAVRVLAILKESGLDTENIPIKWISCKGSAAGRRGYPCSLWMLFHTLTIQSYEKSLKNPSSESNALNATNGVLRGIINYVGHYFSCEECRDNFMTDANSLLRQATFLSDKEAILWLWRVHNGVNKRLAGDISEDPQFPKIQFPSAEQCPKCRADSGQWNEDSVVNFLRGFYSVSQVSRRNDNEKTPLLVHDPKHRRHLFGEIENAEFVTSAASVNGGRLFVVILVFVALAFAGYRWWTGNLRRRALHRDFTFTRPRVKWM